MTPDAELVALLPEIEQTYRAELAAAAALELMLDGDPDEPVYDRLYDLARERFDAVLAKATAMTATTLVGIRIKAKVAAMIAAQMSDKQQHPDLDVRTMRNVITDLLALPEGDAP
ncbi:MAG: hypothetical protein AB7P02_00065 [Alphaproteobacteria bacterium]